MGISFSPIPQRRAFLPNKKMYISTELVSKFLIIDRLSNSNAISGLVSNNVGCNIATSPPNPAPIGIFFIECNLTI